MRAIDYFDKASEVFPDRIALIDGDVRFTYRELRAASERVARAMRAAGLCDEERVAIYKTPNFDASKKYPATVLRMPAFEPPTFGQTRKYARDDLW